MKGSLLVFLFLVSHAVAQSQAMYEWTLVFNLKPGLNGAVKGPAQSGSITTVMDSNGAPTWTFQEVTGDTAEYSSIFTPNVLKGTYMEYGNITFSDGNQISFTSVTDNGSLMGFAGTTQYGAVHYEITGGTGIFENVKGAMTDIFTRTGVAIQLSLWGKCWSV